MPAPEQRNDRSQSLDICLNPDDWPNQPKIESSKTCVEGAEIVMQIYGQCTLLAQKNPE